MRSMDLYKFQSCRSGSTLIHFIPASQVRVAKQIHKDQTKITRISYFPINDTFLTHTNEKKITAWRILFFGGNYFVDIFSIQIQIQMKWTAIPIKQKQKKHLFAFLLMKFNLISFFYLSFLISSNLLSYMVKWTWSENLCMVSL